jgi:hypothetical protein
MTTFKIIAGSDLHGFFDPNVTPYSSDARVSPCASNRHKIQRALKFDELCDGDRAFHRRNLVTPKGDILIIAGDAITGGTEEEDRAQFIKFLKWLDAQPATLKVFVPGNHEIWIENHLEEARKLVEEFAPSAKMLIDQTIEYRGLKIHGAVGTLCNPNSKQKCAWGAMHSATLDELHWSKIPFDVDIIIVHEFVYQTLGVDARGLVPGCRALRRRVFGTRAANVFQGHHHSTNDEITIGGIHISAVAICDSHGKPSRAFRKVVVEVPREFPKYVA